MSFEIHSSSGKVIHPKDLDQEACDLWLIAIDSRHYAHPPLENHWTNSWYANIGWAIENPYDAEKGWEDVKSVLWTIQARSLYKVLYKAKEREEELAEIGIFLEPYFDLIDHWQSKGYIPVKIEGDQQQ